MLVGEPRVETSGTSMQRVRGQLSKEAVLRSKKGRKSPFSQPERIFSSGMVMAIDATEAMKRKRRGSDAEQYLAAYDALILVFQPFSRYA